MGLESREALVESQAASSLCYAALFDGEMAALCGVVPFSQTALGDSGAGLVWMLSGHACSKHPKAFLRTSRAVADVLLEQYRCLGNLVDARYTAALRWARWLGAELSEPRPVGPRQQLFIPFTLRRMP